ncbi:hypothetical protein DY023_14615 [Microbacterium bovistercoris]|uniref:DUF1269 domain-containing protein n=1 Tax=Microbacterium bovistercoris TaxID=2293570 RepID=A0A371NRA5_9MICO|nr:DUF6325 family protein [Microbacterium bovistercoris]REJ04661.1 hypothetical protein DY023_14615 [Microbacterium bovistercoris]
MTEFRYGPLEYTLVGFEGDKPDASVIDALTEMLGTGLVRLVDFLLISKSDAGEVTVVEVEDDPDGLDLGDIALAASGITGEEDIAEFAELVPPGGSAALVALEMTYQRELARRFAASGGVVLRHERIPAPVVNALIDHIENEGV